MSILSQSGKIILVRQPVSGRFGIHRLMAMLSSNQLGVGWTGTEEISVVTFNAKRTICKILHIDAYGTDCTSRILNYGKFRTLLQDDLLPVHLSRNELELLLNGGELPDSQSLNAIKGGCLKRKKILLNFFKNFFTIAFKSLTSKN